MRISIQLKPRVARGVHEVLNIPSARGKVDQEIAHFFDVIQKHGGNLQAVHPGASHEMLLPFFAAEIAAAESAQALLSELKSLDMVDSAYLAPLPQLPKS